MFKKLICLFGLVGLVGCASALDIPRFYGEEIVVTASRYPQLISESPASITVVTAKEIQASGAINVADALRLVSGVDIKSTGYLWGENTIRLRGSTSDQILLLVDGRRNNSPQGAWNQFDNISLGDIEKIEVVRGPASALYGADAVGGVVNIITKKGVKPETNISASLSTFNTQKYSITHSLSHKALNGFFAAESTRSDGQRPNSDYDGQNFKGKVTWNIREKVDLALSAGLYQATKGVPNTIVTPSLTDRQTDRKGYIDLSGNLGNIEVRTYQNQFDRKFSSATISQHKNWTDGIELGLNLPYLSSGFEWRGDRIESTENGGHATYNLALFLQKEIEFDRSLKVVLGARGDKHSVFGSVLSPRAGLIYHPVPDTTIRSSWGESFRAPNFDDLYWPTTPWVAGNPNLRPEKAQTIDLGIDRSFDNSMVASLGLFTSNINDMIGWAPGSDGVWRPSNVDTAKLEGGEAELKKSFTPLFSGFINYTYLKAVDTATNKELIYKPNNKANLGFRFDEDRLKAYVTLKYIDKQFTDSANTDILPSYTIVDAGMERAPLTLKINNLFNENYQESKDYPMPGRTFTLGAVYNY